MKKNSEIVASLDPLTLDDKVLHILVTADFFGFITEDDTLYTLSKAAHTILLFDRDHFKEEHPEGFFVRLNSQEYMTYRSILTNVQIKLLSDRYKPNKPSKP